MTFDQIASRGLDTNKIITKENLKGKAIEGMTEGQMIAKHINPWLGSLIGLIPFGIIEYIALILLGGEDLLIPVMIVTYLLIVWEVKREQQQFKKQ